jgi:hypothetical protein
LISCAETCVVSDAAWITHFTVVYFPFFAPYLLRPRLRPSTPSASRVPRTM